MVSVHFLSLVIHPSPSCVMLTMTFLTVPNQEDTDNASTASINNIFISDLPVNVISQYLPASLYSPYNMATGSDN